MDGFPDLLNRTASTATGTTPPAFPFLLCTLPPPSTHHTTCLHIEHLFLVWIHAAPYLSTFHSYFRNRPVAMLSTKYSEEIEERVYCLGSFLRTFPFCFRLGLLLSTIFPSRRTEKQPHFVSLSLRWELETLYGTFLEHHYNFSLSSISITFYLQ